MGPVRDAYVLAGVTVRGLHLWAGVASKAGAWFKLVGRYGR